MGVRSDSDIVGTEFPSGQLALIYSKSHQTMRIIRGIGFKLIYDQTLNW